MQKMHPAKFPAILELHLILALGAGNAAILVHPYDLPTGALGNLTADAVGIEPVSYPNSLLTGKFTGNLVECCALARL